MAFIANFTIEKISANTIRITDASTWGSAVVGDFSDRYIVIEDYTGETPTGLDEEIAFPIESGVGDSIDIEMPSDMAVNVQEVYVPDVDDEEDTYTKTYLYCFEGANEAMYASREHKVDVQGDVSASNIQKYRECNNILGNLIETAKYQTSVGDLTSAQTLIDRAKLIDLDTIVYSV